MKIPHRIAQILCELLSKDNIKNGNPPTTFQKPEPTEKKLDEMMLLI
jgi:hypothetical protein